MPFLVQCSDCRSGPLLPPCSPSQSQVVEFPEADGPLEFSYDEDWLAVLKATHSLMNLQRRPWPVPAAAPPPSAEQLEDVRRRLAARGARAGGWAGRL